MGYDPWSYNIRRCKADNCKAEVPYGSKKGAYCNGKVSHWNPAEEFGGMRPKCECGGDKVRTVNEMHGHHSYWCPVYSWENE